MRKGRVESVFVSDPPEVWLARLSFLVALGTGFFHISGPWTPWLHLVVGAPFGFLLLLRAIRRMQSRLASAAFVLGLIGAPLGILAGNRFDLDVAHVGLMLIALLLYEASWAWVPTRHA